MFNSKIFFLFALGVLSSSAHAKLIEDGSSFTGTYEIVEPSCYRPSSTSPASAKVLSKVRFLGTPAGIYPNLAVVPGTGYPDDGLLIPVSEPHRNPHGSGIVTSGYAKYLSEEKFIFFSKVERPEYTRSSLDEISIASDTGRLTWITNHFEGTDQESSGITVCHYQRTGSLSPQVHFADNALPTCRDFRQTSCLVCNEVEPKQCKLDAEIMTEVEACRKTCGRG